mmetsp:Transcript_8114/g.26983  ORF Transcript_8114/g.26983 Transcript_8114/m.26983 type:complete len:233 (+) Transcript_8114:434-1132(+)
MCRCLGVSRPMAPPLLPSPPTPRSLSCARTGRATRGPRSRLRSWAISSARAWGRRPCSRKASFAQRSRRSVAPVLERKRLRRRTTTTAAAASERRASTKVWAKRICGRRWRRRKGSLRALRCAGASGALVPESSRPGGDRHCSRAAWKRRSSPASPSPLRRRWRLTRGPRRSRTPRNASSPSCERARASTLQRRALALTPTWAKAVRGTTPLALRWRTSRRLCEKLSRRSEW